MIDSIFKGLGFGLLLSISVGPVLFTIIKQSLSNGHRGGIAFVLGVSASDISVVLVSNIFTALIQSLQAHQTEVRIAGCIFLVSMGIFFLFFKKLKANVGQGQVIKFRKRDYAKTFLSGYFMNTLNPAVFIFWMAAATAVAHRPVEHRIIIFTTCLTWMLLADILKVILAGKIRNRLTPHNIHIINRINGVMLIIFGLVLISSLLF